MDQTPAPVLLEMEAIYCLYTAFARELDPEHGVGGRLLYVGEPEESTTRLLRAANIAGAASLAASADAPALRRMMREGALDFVVTDLDEALRILKNEIRKRQTVAVGVSLAPDRIAGEMVQRGVQPDWIAPDFPDGVERETFLRLGARVVIPEPLAAGLSFLAFPLPRPDTQPTQAFDQELLDALPAGDHLNRRWVRIGTRYLPAAARRFRSIACTSEVAFQWKRRLSKMGCLDIAAE